MWARIKVFNLTAVRNAHKRNQEMYRFWARRKILSYLENNIRANLAQSPFHCISCLYIINCHIQNEIKFTCTLITPYLVKLQISKISLCTLFILIWGLFIMKPYPSLRSRVLSEYITTGFSWKLRLLRSTLCTPGHSCKLLQLPASLRLHSKHVWLLSVGTFDPLFWQLPSLHVVWWEKFESSLVTGLRLDFKLKMDCTTSPRPSASV